jgi:hypothetical protein
MLLFEHVLMGPVHQSSQALGHSSIHEDHEDHEDSSKKTQANLKHIYITSPQNSRPIPLLGLGF